MIRRSAPPDHVPPGLDISLSGQWATVGQRPLSTSAHRFRGTSNRRPGMGWMTRTVSRIAQLALHVRDVALVAPAHREHLEGRREGDAEPLAGRPAEALEELPGIPVLPAEPVDVRRVRPQRLDSGVEGV